MAISAAGISFFPLYWCHQDCWNYFDPNPNGPPAVHFHYGHAHLWMMGFPWGQPGQSQDAFSGTQQYSFQLDDVWGPRSGDPNQMTPYTVIGTPKWYFHVVELWRRVYIQRWDVKNNITNPAIIMGREGIKWDASPLSKICYGPFREGLDPNTKSPYVPLYLPNGGRTLPIEYFTDDTKRRDRRQNYVAQRARAILGPDYNDAEFTLDHDNNLQSVKSQGDPAGRSSFPDSLYIYPIMEYQKVTQLDWERMPGFEVAHDIDDDHFGDGWALDLNVPFIDPRTGKYRSPFGPDTGVVLPPGQYCNSGAHGDDLVPDENRLKYRARNANYDDYWAGLGLTGQQAGEVIRFNDPYNVGDGMWVQQCLGGIIQARAVVTIEHRLGGREDVTVNTTQYSPQTPFAGSDQMAGAKT